MGYSVGIWSTELSRKGHTPELGLISTEVGIEHVSEDTLSDLITEPDLGKTNNESWGSLHIQE